MALLAVLLSGVPRTAGSDQAELWQVSLALLALCTHHLHCLSVELTWFTDACEMLRERLFPLLEVCVAQVLHIPRCIGICRWHKAKKTVTSVTAPFTE